MGLFTSGESTTSQTTITPTSTTGGANSPSLAGDGALALNGPSIGKKGKQDNSVSTKVGNTTTTYKVAKGGSLTFTQVPVGNPTTVTPPTVTVPVSGGGDSSGILASVANLVGAARSTVTGDNAPVSTATVAKYLLIAAFPVVAFVIWAIFFRNKKTA